MTNSNRLQTNCFKLFIILFTILSSHPSFVSTESNLLFIQDITTCAKNSPESTIFQFQTNAINGQITVEDNKYYKIENTSIDVIHVKLKSAVQGDNFTFKLTIDSNTIKVRGKFIKVCDDSNTSSCTVIIAFLASLCLILFTALALTLIILRRKKPITFKFGQKEDKDYDNKELNDNYEENYDNQNKSPSIDVTNNIVVNNKSNSVERVERVESPRVLQPRKSSLKPTKSLTDQLNNNLSSHENGAFNGTELEVVDEIEEKIEEKPEFQDSRRKSIVTFSEKTQVKYA